MDRQLIFAKARRSGMNLCAYHTFLSFRILSGETIFFVGDIDYLKNFCLGFNLDVEKVFIQPNLKIEYNWNGSVRRIYQPPKKFSGYNIKINTEKPIKIQ